MNNIFEETVTSECGETTNFDYGKTIIDYHGERMTLMMIRL